MEILRKNQKQILEVKSTITKMKNALDGLTTRQGKAKERISELDDTSIESLITKRQREQKQTKEQNIKRLWDNDKRWNISGMGIPVVEE